jgi:hypothetical protein
MEGDDPALLVTLCYLRIRVIAGAVVAQAAA